MASIPSSRITRSRKLKGAGWADVTRDDSSNSAAAVIGRIRRSMNQQILAGLTRCPDARPHRTPVSRNPCVGVVELIWIVDRRHVAVRLDPCRPVTDVHG